VEGKEREASAGSGQVGLSIACSQALKQASIQRSVEPYQVEREGRTDCICSSSVWLLRTVGSVGYGTSLPVAGVGDWPSPGLTSSSTLAVVCSALGSSGALLSAGRPPPMAKSGVVDVEALAAGGGGWRTGASRSAVTTGSDGGPIGTASAPLPVSG